MKGTTFWAGRTRAAPRTRHAGRSSRVPPLGERTGQTIPLRSLSASWRRSSPRARPASSPTHSPGPAPPSSPPATSDARRSASRSTNGTPKPPQNALRKPHWRSHDPAAHRPRRGPRLPGILHLRRPRGPPQPPRDDGEPGTGTPQLDGGPPRLGPRRRVQPQGRRSQRPDRGDPRRDREAAPPTEGDPMTHPLHTLGRTDRAALHELRCWECRVTLTSWAQRPVGMKRGHPPKLPQQRRALVERARRAADVGWRRPAECGRPAAAAYARADAIRAETEKLRRQRKETR